MRLVLTGRENYKRKEVRALPFSIDPEISRVLESPRFVSPCEIDVHINYAADINYTLYTRESAVFIYGKFIEQSFNCRMKRYRCFPIYLLRSLDFWLLRHDLSLVLIATCQPAGPSELAATREERGGIIHWAYEPKGIVCHRYESRLYSTQPRGCQRVQEETVSLLSWSPLSETTWFRAQRRQGALKMLEKTIPLSLAVHVRARSIRVLGDFPLNSQTRSDAISFLLISSCDRVYLCL